MHHLRVDFCGVYSKTGVLVCVVLIGWLALGLFLLCVEGNIYSELGGLRSPCHFLSVVVLCCRIQEAYYKFQKCKSGFKATK